jgi:hypothetical protein
VVINYNYSVLNLIAMAEVLFRLTLKLFVEYNDRFGS